ncbi:MAG TPA: hypothetical protein VHB99_01550 [Pirellulales bacterium]|nr:hypothetical protein [Pirellulales bacterium]
MAKEIDVYRDWLGITETARPLNHYQLLRLDLFEDDPAKARANYRKMNAHVRKYAAGEYGDRSQELLNELAKAMLCLTDNLRKAEYDASLGRQSGGVQKGQAGRSFEELLLARKILDSSALDKARRLSRTIGVEVRDAVMQQKLAPADQVMQIYAESLGLPYVEIADVSIDESLIPKVPAVYARQQSVAPLLVDDGRVLIVASHQLPPEVEDQLRLRFGMPVRTVLCTPSSINDAITKYYPREQAAAELAAGPPKIDSKSAKAEAKAEVNKSAEEKPTRRAGVDPAERAAAKKKRNMSALVAFNFGFMGVMLVLVMAGYTLPWGMMKSAFVAAVSGAVIGGVTWVVMELKGP